jgi:chromosome segregation ATPase
MTKLTKSVNNNDENNNSNDNINTSFSLSKKVEKNTEIVNQEEINSTQISQTIQGDKKTSTQITTVSSVEDISKWLLSFIGSDIFNQLKSNEYLKLPYTDEQITISQWLEKAVKTLFPQESIQKIAAQIQSNQERTARLEQMSVQIEDEKAKMEEKFKQYNLKFQELKSQIDDAEDEKHKIKSEFNSTLPLNTFISEFYNDPSDHSEELKKLITTLNEALQNKDASVGKFIVRFSKGWAYLKSSFIQFPVDEKDKLEKVHSTLTVFLTFISGTFIPERRPLLDIIAKICSQKFDGYDFISPEQTLNLDPEIHNISGTGGGMIKEGITFAVVRRESRKAVKYAEIVRS